MNIANSDARDKATPLSPADILKVATSRWKACGGGKDVLTKLTMELEDQRHRLPDDRVPIYLAKLAAHPMARIIGFTLPPECQALLVDASADPDDALLSVAEAPATVPQEPEAKSEPTRSVLHQAARDYAARGWPVFPCVSNEQGKGLPDKQRKKPACPHGYKDATTDLAQLDAWWLENPDYNIGFSPESAGLAVIDRDIGGDVAPLDLPATLQARTQSGGDHFFLVGSLLNSASKLGPKIDTRGAGGYVLLAPSRVNDRDYTWANDLEPAPLPTEITAKLAPKAEPAKAPDGVEIDLPANIEKAQQRLRDLVKDGRVAIEGRGGDDFTYKVTCELVRDLALSEEKALELLETEFNPHCQPPWTREELIAKVNRVSSYGQNDPGAKTVPPASETFAMLPTPDHGSDQKRGKPEAPQDALSNDPDQDRDIQRWMKRLGGSRPIDDVDLPAPQWWDDDKTIQRGDPEGYVVLYQGAKGAMKTYITISKLMILVRDKGARVAFFAGEGSYGVRTTRVQAIASAHGIPLETLSKNWVTYKSAPNLFNDNAGQAMMRLIDMHFPEGVDFIVLDTLGQASPGQDLNSPAFGTALTERTKFIRERYSCVLEVIHHTGKDEKRGALGSSMIIADPGTICEFRKIKGKPNMREERVIHVREGEGERSIGYRLVTTPSVKGVPAPVPVRVNDLELQTAKGGEYPDKLTDDQRKFRNLVAEELEKLGAYDYTARITNLKLAMALFPRLANERGYVKEDEYQRYVDKIIEDLRRGTVKRGTHRPVLDGLFAMELPPAAQAGQRKERYWFVPRLLDDDGDELED